MCCNGSALLLLKLLKQFEKENYVKVFTPLDLMMAIRLVRNHSSAYSSLLIE